MEKLLGHPYFCGLAMQRLTQKGGCPDFCFVSKRVLWLRDSQFGTRYEFNWKWFLGDIILHLSSAIVVLLPL